MKTIGLIGGTSWESTAVYYRLLNEGMRARRGGLHSARIVLASLDFAPLAAAMARDDWDLVAGTLAGAARQVEAAGAECVGLCTNTMHKVAGALGEVLSVPFVDIVDVTAAALARQGFRRPLLLATRFTMEHDFYRAHLAAHDIDARIPPAPEREALQRIIFDELCRGAVVPSSRQAVRAMVAAAASEGCDAAIFGCTEIGLLLTPADLALPVLDTTVLHCEALLDFALSSTATATSAAA